MKHKLLLLILAGLMASVCPAVLADDIALSSEQSDYYYLIGTEAKVPFDVESAYQNTLIGNLQYSLTRFQNEGGFSISQSSTQSQSFPIAPGTSHHGITLTSDEPADYDLSLLLLYTDKGKDFAAILPTISVHFVTDQKEIVEQKNTVRSTTSEASKSPAASSTPDPFDAMEQQMERMRQEQQQMLQTFFSPTGSGMSSQSGSGSQNPAQSLQNNQMSSSSSALLQQMTEESEEAKQSRQELAEQIEDDPLIREQAKDLQKAGYNQTNGRIVSTGQGKGEISATFKSDEGNAVSVTGNADDNKVSSLQAQAEGEIPVPPGLSSNSTWNELKEDLQNRSYTPTEGSITRTPQNTTVSQQYSSPDGRNASLKAEIVNGTVQKVELIEDEEFPLFWLLGIFLVIILVVICAGAAFWYYNSRKEEQHNNLEPEANPPDFHEIVRDLLSEAEKNYHEGNKKEGFALLGQALRTYLSHHYGTGEACTSEELISGVGRYGSDRDRIIKVLTVCSEVEYAKAEPDDRNFSDMLSDVTTMVNRED